MRLSLLTFLLFIIASQNIDAQRFIVNGTVVSGEDNLPMIGVTVLEKGTSNGTATELDGSFQLEVSNPEAIIEFGFIGFEKQEVPIQGRPILAIVLKQESKLMREVVVTGYKREVRSDVASSISSIKSKEIGKLVVVGIDQALQGQAAGVSVTQVTGSPGDDIAVRIRGAGTLGNNNPLYVIDGVPTTGGLNMFAMSDIESIEVLKDAAAAAIYGARAANGVVLITTKKGKSGKPSFNFEAYTGVQNPVNLPKLL
ncbi:MAG: TonB-dependent receptor plug domain-containing protein, partial [Saprospiraceae bacterium]|nr:TonB-dependent receptor plug domain-containing protein [Saprospiraceae bacterium]